MTTPEQSPMSAAFKKNFHHDAEVRSSAPGRINIIGEHTDYNHGYVLPAAIDRRIHFLASRRTDGRIALWSENFSQADEFDAEDFDISKNRPWSNYVRGVVRVLNATGIPVGGFNGWLKGDVPVGSGLSSSAALEVSVLRGLDSLFRLGLDSMRIARLGQQAENEFVGVQCGLMDQFISVFGKPDSAVFLDCVSLEYDILPFALEEHGLSLLIYDTRVKRELAGSEYNRRREESAAALTAMADAGVMTFRDITPDLLSRYRSRLPDAVFRRARHVIRENSRVLESVESLKKGDFFDLGKKLFESHSSLRDDYQVSCPELDLLYDCGRNFPACLGARMTGAGFGGSGIALVEKAKDQEFKALVLAESRKNGFVPPVFHDVDIDGGATAERMI